MSLAVVKSNKRLKIKVRVKCVASCAQYMSMAASCDSPDLFNVCVYKQVGTSALLWINDIHFGKC